jgi:hypothetical protein
MVGGVGYYAYVKLFRDAASPTELVARFDEAGVDCVRTKNLDLGEIRSILCFTSDGKAINVTTYSDGVDYQQWLATHCAVAGNRGARGSAVVSDDWVIDVQRLVNRPPTAARVAGRLADVLGGEVTAYTCGKSG